MCQTQPKELASILFNNSNGLDELFETTLFNRLKRFIPNTVWNDVWNEFNSLRAVGNLNDRLIEIDLDGKGIPSYFSFQRLIF